MTPGDKELLLKDLCARLPYGVKAFDNSLGGIDIFNLTGYDGEDFVDDDGYFYSVADVKPYLFPLSSMTEKQKEELKQEIDKQTEILIERMKNDDCGIDEGKYHFHSLLELEWCIKNHFDYRGLIPLGLAIDATGLNIY